MIYNWMMKFLLSLWKNLHFSQPFQVFLMRFLNDQFLVGVTGVIFNHKNEVLVLKHSYRRSDWSLPGGFLKAKEHPKAGLAREILEETGFEVKVIRIIKTQTDHKGRLDISYFGIYESGNFKPSNEVSEYKFYSPRHLPALIDDQYEQIREGLQRKKAYDGRHPWQRLKNTFSHLAFKS